MTGPQPIDEATTPRLPRHVKLRFDEARGAWVLLAPERVLMPDEIACDVLKRLDGKTQLGALIDALARDYEAPRDLVAGDVTELLRDLAGKGMVSL
ncbi:pyrroloquinoline quinone biosynthesis peptide chaperone PqqD [Arenibaculum pallidiluteum]|uniref:pyrroloquinoline quinone biosynthesis peptide chaperone PqqD n=1 Tax=Arenibaculum pallidiluteum TaxID=2812559 RepID=UPI001A964D45|nr:pyrroloquinoline quinone biosynthesis peptide chaperone PqqD [Arenibaculum pallidiluteum]